MSKTNAFYAERLLHEDEDTILELLDITSEELVKAFKSKIGVRRDYLSAFFEDSEEEKELSVREEERDGPRSLGHKSVWEDAGFDIEDQDY